MWVPAKNSMSRPHVPAANDGHSRYLSSSRGDTNRDRTRAGLKHR